MPLCCFHQEGRAQSAPSDCGFSEQDGSDGPLLRPKDFLTLLRENLREQFSSPAHVPTHTCPPSPELIRSEVEELKTDFNRRIKEVLFNSLFSAYYVAFLPLCFVKVSRPQAVSSRFMDRSSVPLWLAGVKGYVRVVPSPDLQRRRSLLEHMGDVTGD